MEGLLHSFSPGISSRHVLSPLHLFPKALEKNEMWQSCRIITGNRKLLDTRPVHEFNAVVQLFEALLSNFHLSQATYMRT